MRVIFINRFYWPETPATGQLLTDLAEALAARGHDVNVFTSRGAEPDLAARQYHNGVAIRRIRGTRSRGAGAFGKAIDFISFYCGAAWRLSREARRGDIIVALTDPPLIGIAAWAIARMRSAWLIHWVQDIYPEIAIELAGHRWLRAITPSRNRAWRAADACVTLGTDMASVIATAGVPPAKTVVIPNWAPAGLRVANAAEIEALRRGWGLEGKFVVAYSGNLGRVHDIDPILRVADALREDPLIVFVFIGSGAQRDALQSSVARRGLANVQFMPPQPRPHLAATLGAADVHLVTLRSECRRFVFPSKLYGIAAVARPVMFIGPPDSEIARIIARNELGSVATGDDISGVVSQLRSLASGDRPAGISARASQFAVEHSAEAGTAQWITLLENLQAC